MAGWDGVCASLFCMHAGCLVLGSLCGRLVLTLFIPPFLFFSFPLSCFYTTLLFFPVPPFLLSMLELFISRIRSNSHLSFHHSTFPPLFVPK